MSKDNRSRDQKRKAKLAKRAEKQRPTGPQPYTGKKYQSDAWVPHVFATETAIYEVILLSNRTLQNRQVEEAIKQLVVELRRGLSPLLPESEPEIPYVVGKEVDFLIWNIRRAWTSFVKSKGPVPTEDLIGILRTLLNSLEAHAWNTGSSRGYVEFLYGFMQRMPLGSIPEIEEIE